MTGFVRSILKTSYELALDQEQLAKVEEAFETDSNEKDMYDSLAAIDGVIDAGYSHTVDMSSSSLDYEVLGSKDTPELHKAVAGILTACLQSPK